MLQCLHHVHAPACPIKFSHSPWHVPPKKKRLDCSGNSMGTYYWNDRRMILLKEQNLYFDDKQVSHPAGPSNKFQNENAITVRDKMEEDKARAELPILLGALKICISSGNLYAGVRVHAAAIGTGDETRIVVVNTLVHMYAKCGSMVDASRVFNRIMHRNIVSWNSMISGYAETGEWELAFRLFDGMQDEGFIPTARTYVAVLKACASCVAIEEGKQLGAAFVKVVSLEKVITIHSQLARTGHEFDIFVATTLVDLYAKCGAMVHARLVFDRMPFRNVVSWSALIFGYVEGGECELALQLFTCMQDEGCLPNSRTYVAALKACAHCAEKEEGKQYEGNIVKTESLNKGINIHYQVAKSGYEREMFVASILIDMYAKCGSIEHARLVFDKMPHHDVVSWNALIFGCTESGECDLALHLFARMQDEGFTPQALTYVAALKACGGCAEKENEKKEGAHYDTESLEMGIGLHSQLAKSRHELDVFVANTLMDMYGKCGSMEHAHEVFDKMPYHDVVSWTAMINGYTETGEGKLALCLFACMQDNGVMPNSLTYVSILKACGSLSALETGKKIHVQIRDAGLENDALIGISLIGFYGHCGSMQNAHKVFDSMLGKNLFAWNTLLAAYALQGNANCVFDMFERIQDECFQPNGRTFLSILTVCSHAGLVNKGKMFFQAMCVHHKITPDLKHYSCIADLLGRANHLDEAVVMVQNMPFQPNPASWKAVLSASRKWKNMVVGRLAFDSILGLNDKDAPSYALMANIYAQQKSAVVEVMDLN